MGARVKIRNDLRDGDLREIAYLHESLYSEEYDYNEEFAQYVTGILMEFSRPHHDGERIWIVEKNGRIMGCLGVVRHTHEEAQLRWFLIHPEIRGQGVGSKIFKEAVDFIKKSGYQRAFFTTQKRLVEAARIYKKFGFELVDQRIVNEWGHDLVSQRYELEIR